MILRLLYYLKWKVKKSEENSAYVLPFVVLDSIGLQLIVM